MHEKLELYQEKKRFIENLNEVFQMDPKCPTVVGVSYEVFTKQFKEDRVDTREWIVVHYTGGGKAPKVVTGNSNIANFRIVGSLLAGGRYEEVRMYDDQKILGYQKIEL